ncbi:MAG: fibronectin type III domain-containing protein [Kofleriaceae bacterium]
MKHAGGLAFTFSFAIALGSSPAASEDCRVLDVNFTTAEAQNGNREFAPQIVAWLETPAGTFVDTVLITRETGSYGIGNRPGRYDFNSGPMWPYGRRTTVFPVWSNRQPLEWPMLVARDDDDNDLSHSTSHSSDDYHFCRPLKTTEGDWDAMTCPSVRNLSDKGKPHPSMTVRYPPRNDLMRMAQDDPAAETYAMLNPFDAVSMATPPAGVPTTYSYRLPFEIAAGDYVLFVEVSKEFDMNATYNASVYPAPTGIPWAAYGEPYRGQPSVVYRVPFTLGATETTASTDSYAGYGDPDGLDGNLRAPDGTISVDPGTGAARLALVTESSLAYRVKVTSRMENDPVAPGKPGGLAVEVASASAAVLQFTAPGDDGLTGPIRGYEVRFRVGDQITDDNFDESFEFTRMSPIEVAAPGTMTKVTVENLLPETPYSIGVRAIDDCRNAGPVASVDLLTDERAQGRVDACFVATAAYGSLLANDVEVLRKFRDRTLRKTALGELAVEAYYTFGPILAGVISESELLRHTAREALAPVVRGVAR